MGHGEELRTYEVSDEFRGVMESKTGCAIVMAGSDSDFTKPTPEQSHGTKVIKGLSKYEVPHLVRIVSAHKQAGALDEALNYFASIDGAYAVIAIAGGTDALSGTGGWHPTTPVISCPPEGSRGEVNMSSLSNPPGSSNLYVKRPENVGRSVAQFYSHFNPRFKELLKASVETKVTALEAADKRLSGLYERVHFGGDE